ncbi:hypothetical protein A3860_18205 [Niastella vici]|uniref:Uncharacterized protein n=1 Tax=Niastella vici TaxID=1703345 RepID=A0A1V9G216_9BACT|nr:hypothetical protein A3860_18205 [Niastella vici]
MYHITGSPAIETWFPATHYLCTPFGGQAFSATGRKSVLLAFKSQKIRQFDLPVRTGKIID